MNFNLVYILKWAKNSSLSLKVRQIRIISRIFIKRSTISIIEPLDHTKEVSSRKMLNERPLLRDGLNLGVRHEHIKIT